LNIGLLRVLIISIRKFYRTFHQQAAQTAAYEPYGRLNQYGQGITGLAGGVASMQYQQPQQSNPWASALGTALGVGGMFGKIYG